jgi:hypothetical protein
MAIGFLFLSGLGVDVFRRAADIPVMIIFVGLTLIYTFEIPTRLFLMASGQPPRRSAPGGHGNLAHVLHLRHHRESGARGQGTGLARTELQLFASDAEVPGVWLPSLRGSNREGSVYTS